MKTQIKRKAYFKVAEVLKEHRIPILVGLRRTGKTTILNQLSKKFTHSIIITCDDVFVRSMNDNDFMTYIDGFITSGYKYIFLDEIQVIDKWDLMVKNLFDRYNSIGINFVVTGSSSMSFESKDTGVTRTEKVLIHTLDFDEYLELSGVDRTFKEFENFLSIGAFPEFIGEDISPEKMMTLSLQPIINDDIPNSHNVNMSNLIRLLVEITSLSNGEFNAQNSSRNTGIKVDQIMNYLFILKNTHIIKIIYQVNENVTFKKYRKFKIYINPHFHLWLLRKSFSELDPKFKGHIIESYWLFWATQLNGYYKQFYYYKNKLKQEIDLVTIDPSNKKFKTLHEFKYTDNATSLNYNLLYITPSINKVVWCKETAQIKGIKFISILDINDN